MYELGTLPVEFEETIRDLYLEACLARQSMPDPNDPEQQAQVQRVIANRTETPIEVVTNAGADIHEMMVAFQGVTAAFALPRLL